MARDFGIGNTADRVVYDITANPYPFTHRHTVSCWFYRTADAANLYRAVMESDSSGLARWVLGENNNGTQGAPSFRYYLYASGGLYQCSWVFPHGPLNTWQHVAVSHDTTTIGTTPTCYLNGVAQSLSFYDSWGSAVSTLGSVLRLGNNVGGTNGWCGRLQNIANWSEILSAAEIQSLARGTSPHRIRTSKLMWHYPMFQTTEEGDWAGGRPGAVRTGTTVVPGQVPSGPLLIE